MLSTVVLSVLYGWPNALPTLFKGISHFLTLILITTPLLISSWYLVTDGSTLATALLGLLVAATASHTCCMSFCRPSCQLVYSSRGRRRWGHWGCCQHAPCPPSIIPWYIGPVGNDLQWPLCHDCIARSTEILCKNEHRDALLKWDFYISAVTIYHIPKISHPYFHWYSYQNTSVCMH